MDINDLMKRFAQLSPQAQVGRGPENPEEPNLDLADQTSRWLDLHPFLQRDPGYVAFLKRYSGAAVHDPEQDLEIDIHGLSGVGSYLTEVDYGVFDDTVPRIDEFGFYPFASVYFNVGDPKAFESYVGVGFSFDARGNRPWGVYRGITPQVGAETAEHVYCDTFQEWLERVIERRGRLS
jgi:hypothetical protein